MRADEKKCPQCAEVVKAEAKVCRFCGHAFVTAPSPDLGDSAKPKPAMGMGAGKGCLIALGIFVGLGIIGSLANPTADTTTSATKAAAEDVSMNTADASIAPSSGEELPSAAQEPAEAANSGLFGPRANAARSAQQYLAMTGFSRRGLIEQLSSDAGEGYSVADATAAVDSLTVDWNEQAARSAKQYVEMTGFSCSGLIDQLSSDAGSKYTRTQARYGAEQAGAC